MIKIAEKYSLKGNLCANYGAYLLASEETLYSLACEKKGRADATLESLALADAKSLLGIFTKDSDLDSYVPALTDAKNEDARAGKIIMRLAAKLIACKDEISLLAVLKDFYRRNGSGLFALYRGFTVTEQGELKPVLSYSDVTFDDIFGYERQKKQLCANTEAFLAGKNANNVLLYGDSGTGKSTAVKALLPKYEKRGLRIIGVQKHQFAYLPDIISELSLRAYKFILYLDDLSFENFETEYKYLKAIIEGGVAERPENILIYATSNRRHLVKETFEDREGGGDIHRAETTSEQISLSERFGLQIYYAKPDKQEYMDMVLFLAESEYPHIPQDELIAEANAWAVKHGGYSGRAAHQYILSLGDRK
jgi:predicted AAA+ superfamily ATPase